MEEGGGPLCKVLQGCCACRNMLPAPGGGAAGEAREAGRLLVEVVVQARKFHADYVAAGTSAVQCSP